MTARWLLAAVILMSGGLARAAEEKPADEKPEPKLIAYGKSRLLCGLANAKVAESSGVACSRRKEGVFWTHNDSGDRPRIYAFNAKGEDLGTFELVGAKARDWEDMASFRLGGKCYLMIADIGDNGSRRTHCTLYIVEEPVLRPEAKAAAGRARLVRTIQFQYEDGPRDCESVAIDPNTRIIFLVSKIVGLKCQVYAFRMPRSGAKGRVVARPIATVGIPAATAMDMSPDGSRCVVLSYGPAFEFTRRPGEKWNRAFARGSRRINMPLRRQGEAICYGADGKTLYLTSEGQPAPFWQVPVAKSEPPTERRKEQ